MGRMVLPGSDCRSAIGNLKAAALLQSTLASCVAGPYQVVCNGAESMQVLETKHAAKAWFALRPASVPDREGCISAGASRPRILLS